MKKVFLIHGFRGSPNESFFPWLMRSLKDEGIYSCSLPLPSPDEPKVSEWINTISFNVGNPSNEIFLVGHSLGVPAILRYLESLPLDTRIGGVVLISGPFENLKDEEHKILDPFYENSFDFNYIKKVCEKFSIIHAKQDDLVPVSHAFLLAEKLGVNVTVLPTGWHLVEDEGVRELPEALEELEKMIL